MAGFIRGLKRTVLDASSEISQLRSSLQTAQAEASRAPEFHGADGCRRAQLRDGLRHAKQLLACP